MSPSIAIARAARLAISPGVRATTLSTLSAAVRTSRGLRAPSAPPPPSIPSSSPSLHPSPSPSSTSTSTPSAAARMAQGQLLPSSLIDSLVLSRISHLSPFTPINTSSSSTTSTWTTPIILDGYPRTPAQAVTLAALGTPLVAVVLTAPRATALARMRARRAGRADDADPRAGAARLDAYEMHIGGVVSALRARGVTVLEVDASANDPAVVFDNVRAALGLAQSGKGKGMYDGGIVALAGPPAVGKGTQGRLIAKAVHGKHLSVGDVVRQHVAGM